MNFFNALQHARPLRIAAIAVAALLGLLALGELAGWPFLRAPLAQQLSKATGAPVSLEGRFRVQLLFNPGMAVERITVGSGSAVAVPHLLQAQGLRVQWRLSDLWRSRQGAPLRLKRLEANQIDAHLVRLANGNTSWAPARAQGERNTAPAELPRIETLVLRQGTIAYRDEPLNIRLQAQIAQSPEASTPLPWRAVVSGRYRGAQVDLQAQAGPDLPLLMPAQGNAATTSVSKPTPLRLSGRVGSTQLDFDGATGALWAGQGMRGQLSLRGASLRTSGAPLGVTLPDTPAYHLRGRIARDGAVWSLVTNDATVGTSELTAALQYDSAARPPLLVGRLGGRRLAFADLAPAIGADTAPRQASRVLPDETFDLPSLSQMDANVWIDLKQLDFGTPKLAPMADLKVHLTLASSHLALDDLSARVAGGVLTGSTRLQADQQPPRWTAALRLAGVDLDRWIRALNKTSQPDNAPAYLSGTLNAKLSLAGQGNSVAQILGSGNGRLELELVKGTISQLVTEAVGLDAAQALGMLIVGDEPLRLNCARGVAVIQNGVIKTRHAVLDNDDSTLRIEGGASLKTEQLRLRVVAQPKDFSPFSLRTPLNIAGNFKQPEVSVEAQGLLARAAGALLLGALAPPAALLAFMDTGTDTDTQPCAPVKKPAAPATPKKPQAQPGKTP